jgi:hypothetical protein
MSSRKCPRCGLVNWAEGGACGRCGAGLDGFAPPAPEADAARRGGGLVRRALVVVCVVLLILVGFYVSLLATSEPVTPEQRSLIDRAVASLEEKGLGEHTFALRRLARYRATDNWWNKWNGHRDAYAATNFPFQVVTLYPDFFAKPTDDTERAVILLHEAYHLAGGDEQAASAGVWRDKQRLGWTRDAYGQTHVWRSVREFTAQTAPELFRCGSDGKGDCLE